MNLPNVLTLLRILAVPAIVAPVLIGGTGARWLALILYALAALTDYLDGYLARIMSRQTPLGRLLDPIADKLLIVSAFVSLVELQLAPAWIIVMIIGREFAVSGMRSVAAARGLVIAASHWGKLKTFTQVVAITLLILTHTLERWVQYVNLGKAALWVVLAVAIFSMMEYFARFMKSVDLGSAE